MRSGFCCHENHRAGVQRFRIFISDIGRNVPNGTEDLGASFYNGITGTESDYKKEEETSQKSIMSD